MKKNIKKQYDTLKEVNNVILFPTKSPVMPKEHKGFFGRVIDLAKRGFRI